MNVTLICIHTVSCIFIFEIICVLLDFTKKTCIHGVFGLCCEHTWLLDFNDRCNPEVVMLV